MILTESSIRKLISLIIERGANIQSMAANFDDSAESDVDRDDSTSPEEYIEAKTANVAGLKQNTKDYVERLNSYAKEKNWKKPVITSGFRGPSSQARVMRGNWEREGGSKAGKKYCQGTEYLIGLYRDDIAAKKIGDIFEKNTESEGIKLAANYLKSKPISPHGSGKAVDIRSTGHKNIKNIIYAVANEFKTKGINVKINDETGYKAPHWHVKVG